MKSQTFETIKLVFSQAGHKWAMAVVAFFMLIRESLDNLMKNRTTIVIAHCLSTIRKMDRIIVFEKGRIVETGSHNQLLSGSRLYQKLWKSQVGKFID